MRHTADPVRPADEPGAPAEDGTPTPRRRHAAPRAVAPRAGQGDREGPAARWSAAAWLSGLVVLLGTVVRARQAFSGRSLWLDEAMIADNITGRGYRELLHPLAEHQGAPFGWLWLERTAVLACGTSESALRLVPFLAGAALLVVTWDTARRVLPGPLVPVAVATAALAPGLLRYSGELKPYGSDALAVLVLLDGALLLGGRRRGGLTTRTALVAGVVAAAAVAVSYPAVFALAAAGVVLLVQRLRLGDRGGAARLAAAAVLPAGALLVQLLTTIRAIHHDSELTANWGQGYPPAHAGPLGRVTWIGRAADTFSHDPLRLGPAVLVGVLALVGLVALARRRPFAAVLVVAVAGVQLGAGLVRSYPFSGRLALDLVPAAALLLAASLVPIAGLRLRLSVAGAAAVGLAVVLAPPALAAGRLTVTPLTGTELRPVYTRLAAARDGAPVLDYWADGAASDRYAAAAHVPIAGRIGVFPAGGLPCDDARAVAGALLAGHGQVWVVAASIPTSIIPGPPGVGRASDVAVLLRHLDAALQPRGQIRAPGAVAVHYVVRPHGAAAAPRDGECLVHLPT